MRSRSPARAPEGRSASAASEARRDDARGGVGCESGTGDSPAPAPRSDARADGGVSAARRSRSAARSAARSRTRDSKTSTRACASCTRTSTACINKSDTPRGTSSSFSWSSSSLSSSSSPSSPEDGFVFFVFASGAKSASAYAFRRFARARAPSARAALDAARAFSDAAASLAGVMSASKSSESPRAAPSRATNLFQSARAPRARHPATRCASRSRALGSVSVSIRSRIEPARRSESRGVHVRAPTRTCALPGVERVGPESNPAATATGCLSLTRRKISAVARSSRSSSRAAKDASVSIFSCFSRPPPPSSSSSSSSRRNTERATRSRRRSRMCVRRSKKCCGGTNSRWLRSSTSNAATNSVSFKDRGRVDVVVARGWFDEVSARVESSFFRAKKRDLKNGAPEAPTKRLSRVACRFARRRRPSRALPDRLESSSLSAALNPRAVPSVSRNFTVNASYCLGVTCTSSGSSEESEPLRACFGDAPNASRRSLCCSPLASDARRFDGLPAEGGDGFGGMAVWRGAESGSRKEKLREATAAGRRIFSAPASRLTSIETLSAPGVPESTRSAT